MARARTRAKRTVYLVLALALLFMLLELNRWLPGTWPGGGGGGFRAAGELGADDANRTDGAEAPPADAPEDAGVVEPPEAPPPDWPPRKGVVVAVRGPDGSLAGEWRLGVGDGGPEGRRPDANGTLRIRDKQVFAEGFRIRSTAGVLRHRGGANEPAARWSIWLPGGTLPLQQSSPTVTLRVTDAETGEPVVGARAQWEAEGEQRTATTNAAGEAQVRWRGGTPFRVRFEADQHTPLEHIVVPRDPSGGDVRMDPVAEHVVTYAQSPFSVLSARLLDARHREIAKAEVNLRGGGRGQQATFEVPPRKRDGAWLETTVGSATGTYVFRRPLAAVETPLVVPRAKQVTVHVRNEAGETVKTARAIIEVDTHDGPGAEDEPRSSDAPAIQAGDDGRLRFVIPAGGRTRLLVQAPGAAPIVRTLTALDGTDTLEFVAQAGIRVPVQVFGADGKPLAKARVVARTSMEGMRIQRSALTDANGRALVGPFAEGSIELFAGATGHAAAGQVADAAPAMGTIPLHLVRGFPLRVVVADPYGRALAGVDVELTSRGGAAPVVRMPSMDEQVTGADGTLTVHGLPDHLYDVALTLPGYGTQTLRKIRPGAVTYYATLLAR